MICALQQLKVLNNTWYTLSHLCEMSLCVNGCLGYKGYEIDSHTRYYRNPTNVVFKVNQMVKKIYICLYLYLNTK